MNRLVCKDIDRKTLKTGFSPVEAHMIMKRVSHNVDLDQVVYAEVSYSGSTLFLEQLMS